MKDIRVIFTRLMLCVAVTKRDRFLKSNTVYLKGPIPLTFSLPYTTEIPSSFVNERNHKMTQIFVKYILHLCIFRHLKLEIALAISASNDEK